MLLYIMCQSVWHNFIKLARLHSNVSYSEFLRSVHRTVLKTMVMIITTAKFPHEIDN